MWHTFEEEWIQIIIVFTQIVDNFLFSFVTENLSLHVCPLIDWGKRSLKKNLNHAGIKRNQQN